MSNSRDPYTVQAKKYLSDYGIDIETERLTYIDSNGNVDVEALKADIKERLIRGEHINLREYAKTITYIDSNGEEIKIIDPTQHDLVFHNLDDGKAKDTHML